MFPRDFRRGGRRAAGWGVGHVGRTTEETPERVGHSLRTTHVRRRSLATFWVFRFGKWGDGRVLPGLARGSGRRGRTH